MPKTILITGAAGFIGSNLCHYLLQRTNYQVVGIDALLTGSNLNNLPKSDRFFFYRCDLRDKFFMALLEEQPVDIVFHLAAQSHVDRSFNEAENFWSTQVQGTYNICQFAVEKQVEVFVNQISDEVYGPSVYKRAEYEYPFAPTSPYACSKAAQYYVGQSFRKTHHLPIVSTFPCNVFGPRQYKEKIVPKFINLLLGGHKVPLMKSVNFSREWMYVEDHCATLWFLAKNGKIGKDYNVGPGYRIANMELTRLLLGFTGRDESFIEIVPDRQIHDCSYAIDCEQLTMLGWQPDNSWETFHKNLQKTVEWHKEQK